jgi:hypothetical protein
MMQRNTKYRLYVTGLQQQKYAIEKLIPINHNHSSCLYKEWESGNEKGKSLA